MVRRWLAAYLRRRFAWLLALLLLTIGIDPMLEGVGFEARALEWMLAFALFAAAVGTSARGPHFARGLALVFALLTYWYWRRTKPPPAKAAIFTRLKSTPPLLSAAISEV